MRTVSTAGGAPISLTCFAHHGPPRAARLGRVSGLPKEPERTESMVLIVFFTLLGIEKRGRRMGVRGKEPGGPAGSFPRGPAIRR